MSMGFIECGFEVSSGGVEILYDAAKQQQILSVNLVLQMSIPQLLQSLIRFQHSDGRPQMVRGDDAPSSKSPEPQGLATLAGPCRLGAQSEVPDNVTGSVPAATAVAPARLRGLAKSMEKAQRPAPGLGLEAPGVQDHQAWQQCQQPMQEPVGTTLALPPPVSGNHPSFPSPSHVDVRPIPASASSPDVLAAVMAGDVREVRAALRKRDTTRPLEGSLLHAALKTGGQVEMVHLLIQAKCDVDGPAVDRKTPMHVAISRHATLSPLVMRLLLSANANLNVPDAGNVTPLDCIKILAKQSANKSYPGVRQLLDEVSSRSTVAVSVMEGEQVRGALFADSVNDNVVFYTDTTVGFYSLSSRSVIQKKKLTQLRVQSLVRSVSVHPETGTLALFLEVTSADRAEKQNVITVWPTGQIHDEEPLRLIVASEGEPEATYAAEILSSTSSEPVTLLCRILTGKVLCWRLNGACSQIVSEDKLADVSGPIAMSAAGRWIAVSDTSADGGDAIGVWTFEGLGGMAQRLHPQRTATLDRRPQCMAIVERELGTGTCLLAIAERIPLGSIPKPIDILTIHVDGSVGNAYRMHPESPCSMLSFGHDHGDFLLSRHTDGLVIVYNLQQGTLSLSHDDENIRSASMSGDHTLIASTVGSCLRVYEVSGPKSEVT